MNEVLKNWETDYNGAAIYSLVDPEGKRYIGQTMDLKRRLRIHRNELNRLHNDPSAYSAEGCNLANAVKNGKVFEVEVLKYIPWTEATVNELRYWEQFYFNLYGGFENTYNTAAIVSPNYNCEQFNSITLTITDPEVIESLSGIEDVQGYIKDLIRNDIND